MTKLPKRLEEIKAELEAELEVAEIDFKSEKLIQYAKGRISGLDMCSLAVLSEAAKLVEALNEIANEDFRGNRPNSSVVAYKALSDWKKFLGVE